MTLGNGVVQNYTYDNASRLAKQTNDLASTANDLTQTFSYNPASQIASVTRSNDLYAWTGHSNVNFGSTPNGLNQIGNVGAATVTHDTKGNITAVGTDSYGYSSENFLTSGPGSATLSYDPMGRLYQVAQGASTTRMGYDGLDRIAEYNASNAIQRRYIHGPGVDNPIAWYEGSVTTNRRFLSSDERGSIISVTDGSGVVLSLNKYDEFGVPQSTNLGKFGYTGQAWVPEIGLWYYKARFMRPDIGRFMQTDPLGYEDGTNWYAYAGNNPVMLADSLGLSVASGFTPCVGDCSGTITGVDNGDSTGDFVISVPRPTGERNDYQMQKLLSMSQAMYMVQRAYNFVTAEVIGRLLNQQAWNKARRNQCPTGSRTNVGGSYGGTFFFGDRGLSANVTAKVSIPNSVSRTGFAGTQLSISASFTGLMGKGLFVGLGPNGVAGVANGPSPAGGRLSTTSPSAVVQAGAAWGGGGEASMEMPGTSINSASVSGGPRTGAGAYIAAGTTASAEWSSKQAFCTNE